MDTRWLAGRRLDPDAETRLFCLPYAGGSAAAYRGWRGRLPAGLELCALELPGRGGRLGEPAVPRLGRLVEMIADGIAAGLDRPYALFGHSMGGLLAFELARSLRRRGLRPPERVFISAMAPPGTSVARPQLHQAPDEEVLRRLAELGGTPPELLANEELMELLLPVFRADFAVLETYEYRPEAPLAVPLTVCGGRADRNAPPTGLHGWRKHTSADARLHLFDGGHFYLHEQQEHLLGAVLSDLSPAHRSVV